MCACVFIYTYTHTVMYAGPVLFLPLLVGCDFILSCCVFQKTSVS